MNKEQQQLGTKLPILEIFYQFFVSVGLTQSAKLKVTHQPRKMNRLKNGFVLRQTGQQEVLVYIDYIDVLENNPSQYLTRWNLKGLVLSICNQMLQGRTQ